MNFLLFTTSALLTTTALADIKPSALFTDNMVLQRGEGANVFGTATDGEKITATIDGKTSSTIAKDGKFLITLPPHKAGGPYTLTLKGNNTVTLNNVMYGDVWICGGQSNMAWGISRIMGHPKSKAYFPEAKQNKRIRILPVALAASNERQGDVVVTKNENGATWLVNGDKGYLNTSAVGFVFGNEISKHVDIPVGLIHANKGGSKIEPWMSPAALKDAQRPAQKRTWYNGMIAPMLNMKIKGVIWYQGESNATSPKEAKAYANTFKVMIESWRKEFNTPDMPFFFVQLAAWGKKPTNDINWTLMRESQNKALELKNTGVSLAIDVGSWGSIHPSNKVTVGQRLALAARKITYGEDIVHSGPVFDKVNFDGATATLDFSHTGSGLVAKGMKFDKGESKEGILQGFYISGPDKKFLPAKATIKGTQVMLSNPSISNPVAVRYAWKGYPMANLYNKEGLPTSPFRTDSWDEVAIK